ncbi:MAG TPA: hypothetical protein VF682_22275 [Pseudomonas sp.]|jgi:hypothetical protein
MKDELLPILRRNYPKLFSSPDLQEIRCYSGWLDLLDALCRTLQNDMDDHPDARQLVIVQIKEKWGGLRVYVSGGDAFCKGAIALAAEVSLTTCEVCGQPGSLVGERWVSVRCAQHLDWSPDAST